MELFSEMQDSSPVGVVLVDRNVSDWATLPVPGSSKRLLLTMPADDVSVEKLKSLGFSGSVIKPIRPAQLLGAIASVLAPQIPAIAERSDSQSGTLCAASKKPYRILLAEDNQVNQIVASELLISPGMALMWWRTVEQHLPLLENLDSILS